MWALKVYTLSNILLWIKPSYFSLENECYSWCMHQTGLFSSASVVPRSKFTGEFCEAQRLLCHKVNLLSCVARPPQSKSTELCTSAAVIPQSKSTEMWRSAVAVIPQSKSTEMGSSAVPFHNDLWYFRHWTNEHFISMLFIRRNVETHWNVWNWEV